MEIFMVNFILRLNIDFLKSMKVVIRDKILIILKRCRWFYHFRIDSNHFNDGSSFVYLSHSKTMWIGKLKIVIIYHVHSMYKMNVISKATTDANTKHDTDKNYIQHILNKFDRSILILFRSYIDLVHLFINK